MLPNAFIGKPERPTEYELAKELGPAKEAWDHLVSDLAVEYNVAVQEWNSYSRKAGWALRLKSGTRAIVYLSPCRGCFTASFALGDKAVQAARQSKLPERVNKTISEARKYAEGTAVRIDVNGEKDLPAIKKLVKIKLEN